jgi:hypothetical protein
MMHEHDVVRAMLLGIGRDMPGTAPLAKAVLGWARPHARWLLGTRADKTLGWRELRKGVAAAAAPREDEPARALGVAARLAEALCFGEADARVLAAAVAMRALPARHGPCRG